MNSEVNYSLSSIYREYSSLKSKIDIKNNKVASDVIDEENKLISILDQKTLNIKIDLNSQIILMDSDIEKDIWNYIIFLRKFNFFYLPLIFESLYQGYIFLKNGGSSNGDQYVISKPLSL